MPFNLCSDWPDGLYRANNYQQEESEIWIGEWMKERGNRDQMVYVTPNSSTTKMYIYWHPILSIATKYTTGFRTSHRDTEPI